MSFVSQVLGGGYVTKSIKNYASVAGFTPRVIDEQSDGSGGAIAVSSGALTANVLTTVFSATGGGVIMPFLSIRSNDATSRTMRVVVEIDGETVTPAFDYTSASFAESSAGVILAGIMRVTSGVTSQFPIVSSSSLVIKVASSLTETDKFNIQYLYQRVA